MIISKYKKTLGVSLVLFLTVTFTIFNTIEHSCYNNKVFSITECAMTEVNNPSWLNWITSYKSSQFHFFQLLELIHVNDVSPAK